MSPESGFPWRQAARSCGSGSVLDSRPDRGGQVKVIQTLPSPCRPSLCWAPSPRSPAPALSLESVRCHRGRLAGFCEGKLGLFGTWGLPRDLIQTNPGSCRGSISVPRRPERDRGRPGLGLPRPISLSSSVPCSQSPWLCDVLPSTVPQGEHCLWSWAIESDAIKHVARALPACVSSRVDFF